MEKHYSTKFSSSGDILQQLVIKRREEMVQIQSFEADQLKDLENCGQEQIETLKKICPNESLVLLNRKDIQSSEFDNQIAFQ